MPGVFAGARSRLTDVLRSDLRQVLRRLRARPGFTAIAVLSLALGIGANTVIFSVMNTFLFRPLPWDEPDELLNIYRDREAFPYGPLNYPDFQELTSATADLFSDLGGFQITLSHRELDSGVEPLTGVLVTGNFFSLLGIDAHLGRTIGPEDHLAPGAHPVLMVSYRYWRDSLGRNPAIVGRTLSLAGREYTIIGVGPENSTSPIPGVTPDFYAPIMMLGDLMPLESDPLASRGSNSFWPIGRLRTGIPPAAVETALERLTDDLRQAWPGVWQAGDRLTARPTADVVLHPGYDHLVITANIAAMTMVGLILLVACLNLSGTLLARAVDRRREIAVRLALGAGRGRLIGQLVTETLLLALAGGAAGLLLAVQALHLVNTIPLPGTLSLDIGLDRTVLGFTFAVTLLTGILVGFGPALRTTRILPAPVLRGGITSSGSVKTITTIRVLVVGQMAAAVVLLVAGGLFLRSYSAVRTQDPGFGTGPTAMLSFMVPSRDYTNDRGRTLVSSFLEEVEALPEVTRAGIICNPHLNTVNYMFLDVNVAGTPPPPDRSAWMVDFTSVDAGFFETAGIELIRGRNFTAADDSRSTPVTIINQALAEQFWPGENPLGRTVTIESTGFPDPVVVGVVRTTAIRTLEEAPRPFLYLPFSQEYNAWVTVMAATRNEAGATAARLYRILREDHPDLVVTNCTTLTDHIGILFVMRRLTSLLATAFAAVVLILAVTGLHGVVRYAISQRTREMGIRMALGAHPRSVTGLMLGGGLRLAAVGGGIGIILALAASRALQALLFDVNATDPVTLILGPVILLLVSVIAALPPALQAGRVDPAVVMRAE